MTRSGKTEGVPLPGSGLALSGAAAPALPKGELNSLSQSLTALTAPSGREPLAKPETLRHSLKPSPWGRWLDAKRQDGRGSFPGSGLALSGAAAPALPKGEPLAWRQTFRCKCKPSGFARASPFGRGGCERSEQTERARTLPAVRLFPQETSAAAAVCLYDPSRENAKSGSPQAARLCSNYK